MRISILLFTAATLAACSLDTSLPQQPMRGRLVGVLDTQGHVPAGEQPIVLSGDDGAKLTQLTDATGAFVFADLKPGLYTVGVTLGGFARFNSGLLRVNSGADTDVGTLQPDWLQNSPDEATLSGKVVASNGGDITGAKLEFVLGSTTIAQLTVAGDGLFVQRLPPATYLLRASHPGYVTPMPRSVDLAPAQVLDLTDQPLILPLNPATLTGTLFEERDGDAPVAANNANVTLDTGETTTSDIAGHFQFTGLSAGPRQVRLAGRDLHDTVPSRPVTLVAGQTTTMPQVTLLLDRSSIIGTIKLADAAPVSGARAEVSGARGNRYAAVVSPDSSDPSLGSFVIPGVPVGTWTVTGRKEQYSAASATVDLQASGPVDTGLLTLARLQGDFLIDDGDATNVDGYSRRLDVTLNFNRFPTTGVATWRASEDASFDGGVTGGGYTGPLQAFTLSATEGPHTVYAQYVDTNGQRSQTFSSTVVLDTMAPAAPTVNLVASGVAGSTKYTNVAQGLRLTVVGTDGTGSGIGKMRVADRVDGSGNVTTAAAPFQLDAQLTRLSVLDGPATAYVQLIDLAGNQSPAGSDTITVDTLAPVGSVAIERGARATDDGYTNSALVTVSGTFSDTSDAGVLIKLANSAVDLDTALYQPASQSAGWFLNPLGEGLKTVSVRFRDVAGNEGPVRNATITFDTTPPTPAALTLLSPTVTRSLAQTLSLVTNPADLSTTQALTLAEESTFTSGTTAGPGAFPGSAQATFTLSAGDGVRTVYARFRDKAGNDAITSAQLTLDTLPPTGSFSLSAPLADGTPSSSFAAATTPLTISIVSGGAVEFRVGDSTMTSCPSTGYGPLVATVLTNQTLPANGIVTLCLRDAAGNPQGPLTQALTLDTTPPSGCALSATGTKVDGTAAPGGKTANRQISVGIASCPDAREMALGEGAVTCTAAANLAWVPFSASTTLVLGGPDGSRPINGCVRDAARNIAPLTGTALTLDTTPPIGPTVSVDNGATFINAAQVTSRGGNIGSVTGSATGAVEWALSETPASFGAWTAVASTPFTFGGVGLRSVFAKFRDDVGNESVAVNDSIVIDVTSPLTAGALFGLVPSPGAQAGFVNDRLINLTLTGAPNDVSGLQVAQSGTGTCPTTVFASSPIVSAAPSFPFNLSGPDGTKTLCLALVDAAGNGSAALAPLSVTLDTIAPSAPVITTAPGLFNISQAVTAGFPAFTVTRAGTITEVNFDRFERAGGALTGWTTNGTTDSVSSSTSFAFTLQADRSNTLRLRAVDKAGNASPEDTVVISWDNTRPAPPVLKNQWVDNGSGRATVYWQTSPTADVTTYRLHYGPVPGDTSMTPVAGFNGTAAVEGVSPISVAATTGVDQSFTVTGLTDTSVSYATVTAVDAAGNESSAPTGNPELGGSGYSRQAVLEPNEVSLNRVYRLPLAGAGTLEAIAVSGTRAYLAGRTNGGCVAGSATLTTVDLSTISSPISLGHVVTAPAVPSITAGPTAFADNTGCTVQSPQATALVDLLVDGPWLFMGSGSKVRIFSLQSPGAPTLTTTIDVGVGNVQQLALVGDRLFVSADPSVVALNVSALYDANPATLPTAMNIIGTVTAPAGDVSGRWVSGMNVSRDRLLQYTHNGGENLAYLLTSALTASPTFTWAGNGVAVTGDYLAGLTDQKQLTSGSYLYFSDSSQFSVFGLKSLWNSTTAGPGLKSPNDLVSQLSSVGGGAFDVQGGQAFVPSGNGTTLRSLDLDDLTSMRETGLSVTSGGRVASVWGNYLLLAGSADLTLFEIATPRSMHLTATGTGSAAGSSNDVGPGFLYTSVGVTYDQHSGGPLAPLSPSIDFPLGYDTWAYDMARFGDTVVSAHGQGFILFDTSKQTDRDGATTWSQAGDTVTAVLPVTTRRVTGVEAWGNWLIAAEIRSDGLWLEAFDARLIRNRQMGTFDASSQSRASFQVANIATTNSMWASLTVVDGRAIIGLDDHLGAPTPGLYIVDLRPMVDDSNVGSASVLATLPLLGVRETVVRGGWLYAATSSAVSIVDIKEVMDENVGTVLPGSPARTDYTAVGASDSLAVYGNYLFQVGRAGQFVRAIDVRQPLTPSVVSVLGIPANSYSGYATVEASYGPSVKPSRQAISIRGSRLYYTAQNVAQVAELE